MHECLEMMQEMALLVALTGAQLDTIENTIDQAKDFTLVAEQKLVDAKSHHKSAKKVLLPPLRKCAASLFCFCL